MATEHPRLKLGKSAAFVKTVKRLPQVKETWEADFRVLPRLPGQAETHYLGVVAALPNGDPCTTYTPNVNDLAALLAGALCRPLTGPARRPDNIRFRGNPRWEELFRHLH
jgi:hypothetical protein